MIVLDGTDCSVQVIAGYECSTEQDVGLVTIHRLGGRDRICAQLSYRPIIFRI